MTDDEFDAALIAAAFGLGAEAGWGKVSAAAAARHAGLDLTRAQARFGQTGRILAGFGRLADAHALTGAAAEGPVRDRLFDLLMRRFDFLQMHRPGVLALMKALPLQPVWALYLAQATLESMGWMLEAAGVSARGVRGEITRRGLGVVWALGLRAWMGDETADLSTTMAAVDVALNRADQIAARFTPDMAGGSEIVPFDAAGVEDALMSDPPNLG